MSDQTLMDGTTEKRQSIPKRPSYEALAAKYAHHLKIMQAITRIVNKDEKAEVIFTEALHYLLDALDYRAAQIYRLSPYGEDVWLYLEVGSGSKPVTATGDIFGVNEQNIISDTIRQDQLIVVPDTDEGPYSHYVNDPGGERIRAELAVPLFCEDKEQSRSVIGVLRLQSDRPDSFDEINIELLGNLANLFASTIKTQQMLQQLQSGLQEIKILYNLHVDDQPGQSRSEGQSGVGYRYNGEQVTVAEGLPSTARLTLAKETVTPTVLGDNEQSALVAPIKLYGETIGVLGVEGETDAEIWSPEDMSLLEEVTSQVALAIENSRLLHQTQEQTKELSLLFETSRRLSEIVEIQVIYDVLATQIINYVQADLCRVLLLDKNNTYLNLMIEKRQDVSSGPTIDTTPPSAENIAAIPLWQQFLDKPEFITIAVEQDHPRQSHDGSLRTLSMLPLIFKGSLVGLLEIGHQQPGRRFTQNERQLVQALVSQVAVAVENAQQFQRTEAALAETQKLYEISRALVEAEDLERIYDVVLENVRNFDVDRISISLINPNLVSQNGGVNADTVTIVANWDRESDKILPVGSQISAALFPLVESFSRPPFDPLISEDLSTPENQDKRMDDAFRLFMYEGLGAVTLFSTPMFLGAEYKGVLSISTRQPHTYTDQEVRVYKTLADQSIIAIENRRLFEAVRQERDQTTLLHTIDHELRQAITIAQVEEIILSFTKNVNATHGEIYVTDGRGFWSMASTLLKRDKLPVDQAQAFIEAILGYELMDDALGKQKTLIQNISQISQADIAFELETIGVASMVATPIFSQRSSLRGLLIFFHARENYFTSAEASLIESISLQTLATLENVWLLQQTTIALSETEILFEATRDFNRARHPEELLEILARSFVFTEADAEYGINHMLIAITSELVTIDAPQKFDILARWQNQRGVDGQVILETEISQKRYDFLAQLNSEETQIISYSDLDRITQQNIDQYFGRARSILAIPLTVGNNWLGVLFLSSCSPDFTFSRDLINRVTTLAGQAAVVIQNLQLIEETQQTLYNSEILSQLGQQLIEAESREDIYDLCLNAIAATEPGRGAAIFRYEQEADDTALELAAIWYSPDQTWPSITPGTRFSTNQFGLTRFLGRGKTVIIEDVANDDRLSESMQALLEKLQLRRLVAVPLRFDKAVQGFILISHYEPGTFSSEIIRLYEDMGRQTSGALENLRLLQEAQRRATLLQTAADVSQAATSNLDVDTLLADSVDLIKERFGFYHVSIFMLDEYQKYAVVKASTGEIGKKMVAMPHKLEVGGRSIVGASTSSGEARIAADVGQDSGHFNNPLLPKTRSEMALPLVARGEVLGALDVQSTKRDAFSEIDITILQSMANQLANAIEAALSFQELEKSLDQIRRLNEYHRQEQWGAFLKNQRQETSYRLTKEGDLEVEGGLSTEEIAQVMKAKKPFILSETDAVNSQTEAANKRTPKKRSSSQLFVSMPDIQEPGEPAKLMAPLRLQNDAIIGALDLEVHHQNINWEEDNLAIVEAVTRQAAQAIEATRLFEQTQAAREEAEALFKVGRALVTAESEKAMFQTVLDEMLSTLGLKQGGILLLDPNTDRKMGKMMALYKEGQPVETDEYIPIEGNPSYERLIATKKYLAIEDAINDPLLATVKEINISRNVASLLLVPILIDDEVIGAIGADSVGKPHAFTEWEINLASAMADQLAIMLQNRRLLEETRRRAVQMQTSADVGRVATSILDENLVLEKAVELIRQRFGFYHVQIFLIDAAKKFAVLYKSTGDVGQKLLATQYKVAIGSNSVIGQATVKGESLVIRDANPIDLESPQPQHEFLPDSQAELAIPLQVGTELIGILDVHSDVSNAFTEDDIATLEVLAAQLAIAIQNARTFREQQETAERLREIDKLKTQFLANMSHELRTPLNSIIGFSRVILKGIDGPLTELQTTDLTSIHNSGQHLLSLINNILDLSKIEAGKMDLNFEEIEVAPIVKSVMSVAIALVKDKPVELRQEVPDDLPIVWADPTRIRQIVLNLVSNACKFTDQGSVTLKVRADQKRLTISVTDTGIGIPTEDLDSIFEEFTQVDASTTRKVGGTGLGLPISRHFVEMHGGKIWVESTPGRGSTFNFTIPIKRNGEAESDGESLETDEVQERVVVAIDDDEGVIKLYERFLAPQGYKVIGLNGGEQTLAQVKEQMPFAILLDVLMPGRDGWSILRELKKDAYTANVPVIVCSIISDKKRAFALGAADYLIKPIMGPDLVGALKHLDHQAKEQITVLVIDDQADDILLIRRMLEAQSNYAIIEARSGKVGLELVQSRHPDLVVLDLNMPEINGFEVIETLKGSATTQDIPIIIVSAQNPSPEEEDFLSGQVEAVLHKGLFTERDLLEGVQQALSHLHPEETL